MMATDQSFRDILKIIADLSKNDVNTNVLDTSVIERSNLLPVEVNDCLFSIGSIKMLKRKSNAEYYKRTPGIIV